MNTKMDAKDLVALIEIILEHDLNHYESIKEIRYHFAMGLSEAYNMLRLGLKHFVSNGNYRAIAKCYQFNILIPNNPIIK